MPRFRAPEFPQAPFRQRGAGDIPETMGAVVRGAQVFDGPYGAPGVGERAPHQDGGALVEDLIGDFQGTGETIMGLLDVPFEAIGVDGPHRILDNASDLASGIARNIVRRLTR